MNQENLKFLQDRLFFLGTEKRLFVDLEKQMSGGKSEFKLPFANHYDQDKLNATLHFRKSETQDMYFLNRYDAVLQKPGEESKSRTFQLDNGKGITMKEAYNLLDGRSVFKEMKNKEGEKYEAWVKLDPLNKDENGNAKILQYHKNYGFDLQSEMMKLPIHHLAPETMSQMKASLEKGNAYSITIHEKHGNFTMQVAANPQFKTFDMFENGKPMSKDDKAIMYIFGEDQRLSLAKTSLDVDKVQTDKSEKVDQKSTIKSPKQEKTESLMPKKHISQKKGLAV